MNPQVQLNIPSLQRRYETGVTVSQVIDEVLKKIADYETIDPAVWIHKESIANLEARANELDAMSAEERYALPLYGIPFAVKDNIDVAGMPTTAGCPGYAYVPDTHAEIVETLFAAGAICLGKTNLDQFATGLVGTRSPYGAPRCVYNKDYISGGSSSGSAVAVAAGLASFALGTDTAGSGRVPAAINNIVGLKPTPGSMSINGIVPACRSLDCPSIFALSPSDATYVFKVLKEACDHQEQDKQSAYDSRDKTQKNHRTKMHFGVLSDHAQKFYGDEEAKILYNEGLKILQENGCKLSEIDYEPFQDVANLLYQGPWIAERYAAVGEAIDLPDDRTLDGIDNNVKKIIMGGKEHSAVDLFKAQDKLKTLSKVCMQQLSDLDGLILPTCPTVYKINEIVENPIELNSHLGIYTNFVNLLGMCAMAIPAGFRKSNDVPFGITIVSLGDQELKLFALARQIQGLLSRPTGQNRAIAEAAPKEKIIRLAVVGAHLRGQPLNSQLTSIGAQFVEQCWSSPDYGLYALEHLHPARPAMIKKFDQTGYAIELELWDLPGNRFYEFFRGIAPPLGLGTVELFDGRQVNGFIAEHSAMAQGKDISALKKWRNFTK